MVRVSSDDIDTAIEWLRVNEGADGEAEACQRVAALLEAELKRRIADAGVRAAAKALGVKPALVRTALRQRSSVVSERTGERE